VSAAPPGEYAEDAARIDDEYVPSGATSDREIQQALSAAGFPEKSQEHIQDWLVSEEDAWETVGPNVQDAGSVSRELDRQSDGTIADGRREQIAESVGQSINQARAEAAQRVDDNGVIRSENGQFIGSFDSVSEEIREDGIYYRNENTGTTARAARFDR